jgi:thymidylate synthase
MQEEEQKNTTDLQYLQLIKDILKDGDRRETRNGITRSIFGTQMRFNLRDGNMPLLTTKRVPWKTVLRELLWFISGDTSNKTLNEKKVNIWNANSTRDFLDSRGLNSYPEGTLGPVYGHQWRSFNAEYKGAIDPLEYRGKGVDQLQDVIDNIKRDPMSRRHIVSAWNPCQLSEMALPPCHVLFQFYVSNGELSCQLYQRSGDVGLGVPFNITSYSFLTYMIANVCGLKPGEFVYVLGDAHIYEEHIAVLEEQLKREPYKEPRLNILVESGTKTIDEFEESDFEIKDYKFHKKIRMEMKA